MRQVKRVNSRRDFQAGHQGHIFLPWLLAHTPCTVQLTPDNPIHSTYYVIITVTSYLVEFYLDSSTPIFCTSNPVFYLVPPLEKTATFSLKSYCRFRCTLVSTSWQTTSHQPLSFFCPGSLRLETSTVSCRSCSPSHIIPSNSQDTCLVFPAMVMAGLTMDGYLLSMTDAQYSSLIPTIRD
jgi:hypothetical protein